MNLESVRDKLAEEFLRDGIFKGDIVTASFRAGFDAAIAHLGESLEFDEHEAGKEYAQNKYGKRPDLTFIAGARWQHAAMAARVALANQERDMAAKRYRNIELANKELTRNDHATFGDLLTRIADLTQALEKAKEDTPAMCAYCSFELPKGAKLKELQAHINRCEHHPLVQEIDRYDLRCTELRNKLAAAENEIKERKRWLGERDERCGELLSKCAALEKRCALFDEFLRHAKKHYEIYDHEKSHYIREKIEKMLP